jgi:alpha-galactosidase
MITGTVKSAGSTDVVLRASNAAGRSERKFRIVIGDQLALTPPMGWSSWDFLQTEASDGDIRAQADAMVSTGLIDHGYSYISIDDGWSIKHAVAPGGPSPRDAQGNIRPNECFPDMKGLTAYVHSKGMKAGLYTSPAPLTCGKFEASYGHEQQDADQFAAWGFDLLKYDWCGYPAKDRSLAEMQEPYRLMGSILAAEPRGVLFSLCQYGRGDVWTWGREGGRAALENNWRPCLGPKGDYTSWENIVADFDQGDRGKLIGPGGWNDLTICSWVASPMSPSINILQT